MAKKKIAAIYAYDFALKQMRPLLDLEIDQEEIASSFMEQALLEEKATKEIKDEHEVYAKTDIKEFKKEAFGKSEKRTYSLTYVNPVSHKTEVIQEKIDIKITDYTTKMIEESVGINSGYPMYTYIAAPIIRKEVVPWILEEILNQREYDTPPEAGSAAAIKIPDNAKKSEIVAIKKQEEFAREAVIETIKRKEDSQVKLNDEIIVFQEVVKAIRSGKDVKESIKRLPPLSKARYSILIRKKEIDEETLLALLMQDVSFLKGIVKKLRTLTIDGLLDLMNAIKKIKRK
jgi:hypothetical protein